MSVSFTHIFLAESFFYSPPPKPFSPSHDRLRLSARHRDEAIEKRLRPKLPKVLPPDADTQVNALLCKKGIISKVARESVNDRDLSRLLPSQWLNDEIMNFYGAMILTRSESNRDPTAKRKMLDVHYFSTFFWPKLKNEGYEQGRLAKWTKKVRYCAMKLKMMAQSACRLISFRKTSSLFLSTIIILTGPGLP
jgi:sentrin-specific protease 1